jgi:pyruvate dehydrogenase phosphatase
MPALTSESLLAGRVQFASLSLQQAEKKLKEEEESFGSGANLGVNRYDGIRVASNSPVEDEWVHATINIPAGSKLPRQGEFSIWGIFDGHA